MTQDGDGTETTEGTRPTFPRPDDPPGDWDDVVHGSALSDLARLAEWTNGDKRVDPEVSPAAHFEAVEPGSLGRRGDTRPIYVVVHGWAPGYRSVVETADGDIHWWGDDAHVEGRWASDWCWAPVSGPKEFEVNDTGLVQQIARLTESSGGARILAYSWIDDSATKAGMLDKTEVYWSEAYTHLNGIRLANALGQAIDRWFFDNGGEVRLIGHSHGSKVCTVAALALEQRGTPAARLTILDSPESRGARAGNGANLLGVHLHDLKIKDPTSRTAPGTYVDTYTSCFGVRYDSADPGSPIRNVVDVALDPTHVYPWYWLDYADEHTYAAAWYGGAAPHGAGPAWPPVPKEHRPALVQRWGRPDDQWTLTPGLPTTCRFDTHPLTVATLGTPVGVDVALDGTLTFDAAGGGGRYGVFHGAYPIRSSTQYGFAFDLTWMTGGLFVVVGSHEGGTFPYTLLVLDGRSMPPGRTTSVAINHNVWEVERAPAEVTMYYLPAGTADGVGLKVTAFRGVEVG